MPDELNLNGMDLDGMKMLDGEASLEPSAELAEKIGRTGKETDNNGIDDADRS